jgi:hypothetical protein
MAKMQYETNLARTARAGGEMSAAARLLPDGTRW